MLTTSKSSLVITSVTFGENKIKIEFFLRSGGSDDDQGIFSEGQIIFHCDDEENSLYAETLEKVEAMIKENFSLHSDEKEFEGIVLSELQKQ